MGGSGNQIAPLPASFVAVRLGVCVHHTFRCSRHSSVRSYSVATVSCGGVDLVEDERLRPSPAGSARGQRSAARRTPATQRFRRSRRIPEIGHRFGVLHVVSCVCLWSVVTILFVFFSMRARDLSTPLSSRSPPLPTPLGSGVQTRARNATCDPDPRAACVCPSLQVELEVHCSRPGLIRIAPRAQRPARGGRSNLGVGDPIRYRAACGPAVRGARGVDV